MNTDDGLRALIGDDIEKALEDSRVEGKKIGKYSIGSPIGKGGTGEVYLAKDESLGRTVVIKVISFPTRDPEHCKMMVARFRREAQVAGRVMHPNVAMIFSFDEIDGRHLLVMERIEGRTLRDEIMTPAGKPRALAPKRAIKIVIEILRGLEAIHAIKIVHRDLKPGNVMLTDKDDQVKILDFGLGKASESSGDPALDMTLTQQGMPLGSPLYMSPEQIRSLPVDERTDIYSVGVMLFQLLNSRAPFRGKDALAIYDQHRSSAVPAIVASDAEPLPPGLDAIVRKAMAKIPGERYGSASEMRAALEAVAFESKPKAPIKSASRKRAWIPASIAVCAVAAFAVGLALTMGKAPARSGRPEAVIVTAKAEAVAPAKAVDDRDASDGISIPPPPPPSAATSVQGCALYAGGRTSDAIATLTRALKSKPNDAEGLFCLCGAYVRQPEARTEALKACKAYRSRPDRDADKARQVNLWLRRISR